MDTTALLAQNIKGLIDATAGLSEHALSVISNVPKTTIRRMRLNEGAAQIDSVEKIAKAFKLRACDILDPDLLKRLAAGEPDVATRSEAADFVREHLARSWGSQGLPDAPQDLAAWMTANAEAVAAKYSQYLERRAAGGSRRFFSNRAHALHFLRSVAPTKLVDGAWLYGLLPHWRVARNVALVPRRRGSEGADLLAADALHQVDHPLDHLGLGFVARNLVGVGEEQTLQAGGSRRMQRRVQFR